MLIMSIHLSSDFIVNTKPVHSMGVGAVILHMKLKEFKATEPVRWGFEARSVLL